MGLLEECEEAEQRWLASAKALIDAVRSDSAEKANDSTDELFETALDCMKQWQPEQNEDLSKFYVFAMAAYGLQSPADACKNNTLKAVLKKAGGCDLFWANVTETKSYRTPVLMYALESYCLVTDYSDPSIRNAVVLAVLHLAKENGCESKVIAPKGQDRHQTLFFVSDDTLLRDIVSLVDVAECRRLFMTLDLLGNTPLHVAIKGDDYGLTCTILACPWLFEDVLVHCNDEGHTPLHVAVRAGRRDVVIRLLKEVQEFRAECGPTSIWEKLSGVFSYAKLLNKMDILVEALFEVPQAFGAHDIAMMFGMAEPIGTPLVVALVPELMVSTRSNLLWRPKIALGSEPWVKHVKCEKPGWLQQMDKKEGDDEDHKGVRLVIMDDERAKAEKGPGGLLDIGRVDCKAYILPAHVLKSTTVLRALTKASGMLRTPLARGVLADWWVDLEWYYYIDIFLNVLHLCLAMMLTHLSRNGHTEEAKPYIIAAAVLVLKDVVDELLALVDVISELRRRKDTLTVQHCFEYMKYCFEQCVDYSRLAIEVFTLLAFLSQGAGQATDIPAKVVTAVWVFLWWCHCLFDLRGLRSFGPFLMPIFRAINTWSVKNMSLVVFCVLAASTHAYYVLGVRGEPSQLYAAILQMYRLGVLGDFDTFELEGTDPTLVAAGADVWEPVDPQKSDEYELVHCVFYVTTLSITVVLMNLFIGVLGSSYDKATNISEELFLSTRARLVLEYRVALLPRLVNALKGLFGKDSEGSDVREDSEGRPIQEDSEGRAVRQDSERGKGFTVVFLRREDESLDESRWTDVKTEMEAMRQDQLEVSMMLEEVRAELMQFREAWDKEAKRGKSSTELAQGEGVAGEGPDQPAQSSSRATPATASAAPAKVDDAH